MSNLVISYSRKRRGCKRKREQLPDDVKRLKRVCQFCLSEEDNEVNYGTIFEKDNVTVHYFCILLSSGLCQNTRVSDKKSILGFLLSDIKRELQRGAKLRCCFCHNKGATIGCCAKACRKAFHLRCGREHGTMHQFFDSFRSYCENHRLEQELSKKKSHQRSPAKKICSICLCAVTTLASCDTLIPPCCQKSFFHRTCLQQYALSAGMHYFKCPLCNSVEEFQADMQMFGIYIPDQDASWEREPNAFQELLERHNSCDVSECVCPEGRLFDADAGKYELLLCGWCGAYGSHRVCKGLVLRGIHLVCCVCAETIDRAEEKQQEQRDNNYLVETDSQQNDLPFQRTRIRSRSSRLHQPELDEQLPSSSATVRLNTSPRKQTLSQSQNSPGPRRKRQCINSLQDPLPAGLKELQQDRLDAHKQNILRADSKWRLAIEGDLQQSEPVSPGPSRERYSRGSQREERQKCSEEITAPSGTKENTLVCRKKYMGIEERDIRLFDCRVVLRKIDNEVNFMFGRTSVKPLPLKNCRKLCKPHSKYTSVKPGCCNNPSEKKVLEDRHEKDAEGYSGKAALFQSDEEMRNCSIINDISVGKATCSSDESLPDLTFMSSDLGAVGDTSGSDNPPVIEPGVCWHSSPLKHEPRKTNSAAVLELDKENLNEMFVAQVADTESAYEQSVQTSRASCCQEKAVDLQLVDTQSSLPRSIVSHTINEHKVIEKISKQESVLGDEEKRILKKRFQSKASCEPVNKDTVDDEETKGQDLDILLDTSALSESRFLLSEIKNQNVEHGCKDLCVGAGSEEKAGLKCHGKDRMFTQTDIFGNVVFKNSECKKKKVSKSKDSATFLKFSQSKIEDFLVAK